MTSNELHEALRNTYPAPNFMYLKEVRDATGFDGHRTADAIAIGMYRSCGKLIHGFEIKVSRADWLKELKDASKAESLMRYTHRWALITPDTSIVQPGELPSSWGWGVWNQTRKNALPKIKWIVQPPELRPLPMSMVFFTAMLYAATKILEKVNESALKSKYEQGIEDGKKLQLDGRAAEKLERMTKAVEAFEEKSGVQINEYSSEIRASELGVSFADYLKADRNINNQKRELRRLYQNAKQITQSIEVGLNLIERGPEVQATFAELMVAEA